MPGKRTNTQTEQNTEDTGLLTYRVFQVELAIKDFSSRLDKQDNLKKSDLLDLRDAIVGRFNDMRTDFQKQIDSKADQASLDDFKRNFYYLTGFLGSLIIAGFTYLINHR